MSVKVKSLSEAQMIAYLWDLVAEHGSRSAVASLLGITPSYMSDILNGNRSVSDSVARKIGYMRESIFKPIEENE